MTFMFTNTYMCEFDILIFIKNTYLSCKGDPFIPVNASYYSQNTLLSLTMFSFDFYIPYLYNNDSLWSRTTKNYFVLVSLP